jgi:hypothetical protein
MTNLAEKSGWLTVHIFIFYSSKTNMFCLNFSLIYVVNTCFFQLAVLKTMRSWANLNIQRARRQRWSASRYEQRRHSNTYFSFLSSRCHVIKNVIFCFSMRNNDFRRLFFINTQKSEQVPID